MAIWDDLFSGVAPSTQTAEVVIISSGTAAGEILNVPVGANQFGRVTLLSNTASDSAVVTTLKFGTRTILSSAIHAYSTATVFDNQIRLGTPSPLQTEVTGELGENIILESAANTVGDMVIAYQILS